MILDEQSALISSLKSENKNLKHNANLIENELSTTLKNMNDVLYKYILDERSFRRINVGIKQNIEKIRT